MRHTRPQRKATAAAVRSELTQLASAALGHEHIDWRKVAYRATGGDVELAMWLAREEGLIPEEPKPRPRRKRKESTDEGTEEGQRDLPIQFGEAKRA